MNTSKTINSNTFTGNIYKIENEKELCNITGGTFSEGFVAFPQALLNGESETSAKVGASVFLGTLVIGGVGLGVLASYIPGWVKSAVIKSQKRKLKHYGKK